MLDVSLQLIAYKIVSGSSDKGPQSWMTNVSSCSSRILPGEGQLQTHVRKQQKYPFRGQGYIPNVVECSLSMTCHLKERTLIDTSAIS